MKCMTTCLWYFNLKLGAYLICITFMLTSISICILMNSRIFTGLSVFPAPLKVLITLSSMAYGLLFMAACTLLYGLCMEKSWPLLLFIPVTIVVAIGEVTLITYIIVERDLLPDEAIEIVAGQSFILIAVLYSAAEVYSLYLQWQEDSMLGRPRQSIHP